MRRVRVRQAEKAVEAMFGPGKCRRQVHAETPQPRRTDRHQQRRICSAASSEIEEAFLNEIAPGRPVMSM